MKIICPRGVEYKSVAEMCKAYGVDGGTYCRRRQRGISVAESLGVLESYNGVAPNGVDYGSVQNMCEAYGVKYNTFMSRKKRGLSVAECLFQGEYSRKRKKGWEKKLAKQRVAKVVKRPAIIAPDGMKYKSYTAMFEAYGVDVRVANKLRKAGLPLARCLTISSDLDIAESDITAGLCKEYGVSYKTYTGRRKKGFPVGLCLDNTWLAGKLELEFDGMVYADVEDISLEFNINAGGFYYHRSKGYSVKQCVLSGLDAKIACGKLVNDLLVFKGKKYKARDDVIRYIVEVVSTGELLYLTSEEYKNYKG